MIYRFIKITIGFYINLITKFLFKNLAAFSKVSKIID